MLKEFNSLQENTVDFCMNGLNGLFIFNNHVLFEKNKMILLYFVFNVSFLPSLPSIDIEGRLM